MTTRLSPRAIGLAGAIFGGLPFVLLGAFALCLSAQTPGSDTLRLSEAVQMALQANPMLRATRASAVAAAQRVGPAGALPDPEIQFERMRPTYGFNLMAIDQVMLMQMIPFPGKQGSARSAAKHTAAATSADADEQARMLAAQVRMHYFDIAYADRALEVMRRTRGLLRDFLEVSTTMYAVGSAVQQDVLRAQIEVGRMAEEITRMTQERLAMVTRLNALLGRGTAIPIPALELPEPTGELPEADSLIARALQARPALRAGAERVAAAEASLSGARREFLPDVKLGLGYQWWPTLPPLVNFMVGVNLPVFAPWKQLAMRRQMAAMRDMSQAELLNLRNETVARIIETRARAEQDRNLARLYRTAIVPQARTAVQAALASYRVGRLSFMELIDNQMTVNRYDTETYRLFADYHQAVSDLEAWVGGPVEE